MLLGGNARLVYFQNPDAAFHRHLVRVVALPGMARFIANDETKGFGSTGFDELRQLATGSIGPVPMPFVLLILIGIIAYILLHRSVFGRSLCGRRQ
jgi:ribose/xylose/arabinose/galactoside ABC-type transport system permease subunit